MDADAAITVVQVEYSVVPGIHRGCESGDEEDGFACTAVAIVQADIGLQVDERHSLFLSGPSGTVRTNQICDQHVLGWSFRVLFFCVEWYVSDDWKGAECRMSIVQKDV